MDQEQAMKLKPTRGLRRQGTEAHDEAPLPTRITQRTPPVQRSTKEAQADALEAIADVVTNLIPPSEITMKPMVMTTPRPQPPQEVPTPRTQIATTAMPKTTRRSSRRRS